MKIGSTTLIQLDERSAKHSPPVSATTLPSFQSQDTISISSEALDAQQQDAEIVKYAGIPPQGFEEIFLHLFKIMFEEEKQKATQNLAPGESLSEEQLMEIANKVRKSVLAKLGLATEPTDTTATNDSNSKVAQPKVDSIEFEQY